MVGESVKIVAPAMQVNYRPSNLTSSQLPSFALIDAKWTKSANEIVVSIIASSIFLGFVGDSINISATSLCKPGQFVNLHSAFGSGNNV